MRTEWVVLADAARARIFARVGGAGWQAIRDLTRGNNGIAANGREVRLPEGLRRLDTVVRNDANTSNAFVDRLARELVSARKRGDFDSLILIAQPDFLEHLKDALDMATRRKLVATATEDLVSLPLHEARRQISRRY